MMMKRTQIATAVSLVLGMAAFGAQAGTLGLGSGTVSLAKEMFGLNSAETLFTVDPALVTYTPTPLVVGGVVFNHTDDTATIKFTLGGAAVFGEAVNTYATLSNFLTLNATDYLAGVAGAAPTVSMIGAALDGAATDMQWDVVAGGAIGDNTVTIVIRSTDVINAAAADSIRLTNVQIGGFKIKNLTPALATVGGQVRLGVEFASPGDLPGVGDLPTDVVSDTATPAVIFDSALAVSYTVTPAALPRINVADNEKLFTNSIPGDNDFSTPGTVHADLGTVQLALVPNVMKEAGVPFDFQGGDAHTLTLTATGTSAPLKAFDVVGALDNVYLTTGACNGVATAPGLTGARGTVNPTQDGVTFNLTGSTAVLTTAYNMCLTADTVDQIAETTIDSAWAIDYFNDRYINDDLDGAAFNPLRRNGCKVSLFNVPGIDNGADDGFVRLTNTSSTVTGAVRATIYDQAGTIVVANNDVVASVAPHATVVFTPEAGIAGTTQLTDMTGSGRYRLVLTGAFPSCEALGLVRNQSTGMLVNMTATTSANSNSHWDGITGAVIQPGNSGN